MASTVIFTTCFQFLQRRRNKVNYIKQSLIVGKEGSFTLITFDSDSLMFQTCIRKHQLNTCIRKTKALDSPKKEKRTQWSRPRSRTARAFAHGAKTGRDGVRMFSCLKEDTLTATLSSRGRENGGPRGCAQTGHAQGEHVHLRLLPPRVGAEATCRGGSAARDRGARSPRLGSTGGGKRRRF